MEDESRKQAEDLFLRGLPGLLGSFDEDSRPGEKKRRGRPGGGGGDATGVYPCWSCWYAWSYP